MKTLLRIISVVVVLLALVLAVLRITGFNPRGPRAGLWLSGTLVTAPVTDWSFANSYPTIEVQTKTWYLIPDDLGRRVSGSSLLAGAWKLEA
jgi:hypothetical protein